MNLDIATLDGRGLFEKDLHKLYYVYISSKPEDWKFILEVPCPSLGTLFCAALQPEERGQSAFATLRGASRAPASCFLRVQPY